MKNDNYWIRLRNVITFLIIWIGPGAVGHSVLGFTGAYASTIVTWVPAMLIATYLADDD